MPGLSGLDAMRQLRRDRTSAHFIFLTIHSEPRLAAEAMRAVAAGATYLTPLITADVLNLLAQQPDADGPNLTARQRDVLRLIGEGKRMKEIATELGISVRTVEDHRAQLQQALGAESNADLVRHAIPLGRAAGLLPGAVHHRSRQGARAPTPGMEGARAVRVGAEGGVQGVAASGE